MKAPSLKTLLLGGLLPIALFTFIEGYAGTLWGVATAMVWGAGEIVWEKHAMGRISPITLGSNALILALGGVSIAFVDGIWFKLQPAILEGIFGIGIIGALLFATKPLLVMASEKNGMKIPEEVWPRFRGIQLRLGLFFLAQAALATWAAFRWTTEQWALLKGVGFTVSFFAYWGAEMAWLIFLRRRRRRPFHSG